MNITINTEETNKSQYVTDSRELEGVQVGLWEVSGFY